MSYASRLLCLSLASFFLIQLLAGLAVKLCEAAAIRKSGHMAASSGARFLFLLRLLPAGVGAAAVIVLCIPSYLSLEPHARPEPVGPACLIAAFLGAAVCGLAACRAARALVRSIRYQRSCRHAAVQLHLPRERATLWLTASTSPPLALGGIFRPKLLISREAFTALSRKELQSAIGHERAHQHSRDNLKRLMLLLAPDILPLWPALSNYDHAWERVAEWAADDCVASRFPDQTLSLASALVRVARLNAAPARVVPLATSFLPDARELSTRIDRLLTLRANAEPVRSRTAAPAIAAGAFLAVLLAAQTATLQFVHQVLEQLIR